MDYIILNHYELSALSGLPYLQQLTYIQGLKPYVDYQTELIGIKRGVSYQSLSEALYVEPHQGIVQSGSPSKDQIRRALKGLEKAGLITIQSLDNKLIFKCLLLAQDKSAQNKVARMSPAQATRKSTGDNIEKSMDYDNFNQKPATAKTPKPATPQNNNNIFLFFLLNAFDEFWESYPKKEGREQALAAFKKLNPSPALLNDIKAGLQQQVEFYHQQKTAGVWMPAWKYPANWLLQQCWKNTPATTHEEKQHATHTSNFTNQTGNDERLISTAGFSDAEFQKLWK